MKNKGSSISEVLFIIVMLGGFMIPAAIFKFWWIFWVFLIFGTVFGLFEWFAKIKTGKTVSQNFWEWSKQNKAKAWIILAGMLLAWLALLWHLASKMIGG